MTDRDAEFSKNRIARILERQPGGSLVFPAENRDVWEGLRQSSRWRRLAAAAVRSAARTTGERIEPLSASAYLV